MEGNEREETKRRFLTRAIGALSDLPSALCPESEYFVLFLAFDARDIFDLELQQVSKALLDQGCCYLCVWGPDCERVHDRFDSQRELPELKCVMTTWHSEESLREALAFFVYCAWPVDEFAGSPVDWIAVSVSDDDWAEAIQGGLRVLALGD